MGYTATPYITNVTIPAWHALSNAQRSAWHFEAVANPVRYWTGALKTLNGWQYFNWINSQLATCSYSPLVSDPPANYDLPDPHPVKLNLWTVKMKDSFGDTNRTGRVFAIIDVPVPGNRVLSFYNSYEEHRLSPNIAVFPKSKLNTRNQGMFRARTINPGSSGTFDLTVTAVQPGGVNAVGRVIYGGRARQYPDQPVCGLRTISTENGMYVQQQLALS